MVEDRSSETPTVNQLSAALTFSMRPGGANDKSPFHILEKELSSPELLRFGTATECREVGMKGRFLTIVDLKWLLLVIWGFAWMPNLHARTEDRNSAFTEVPFQQWLRDGPRAQLPWKIHIFPTQLSLHERLLVRIQVEVDGNELRKRCCDGRAVALVQISDSQGRIYQNYVINSLKDAKPGINQYMLDLEWSAFVLPGDYQVVLAFHYSGRPEHNLALEKLHVGALRNDPLPESWRGLPQVEFCDAASGEAMDDLFLPGVSGRLYLPVSSRRAVEVDVLENLTPYRMEQRRPKLYKDRLSILLPIFKTFGQLEIQNGALNMATLDFTRARVTYEQDGMRAGDLNWGGLRDALVANNVNVVDVHDIGEDTQYAGYFREEMTKWLKRKKTEDGSPKRVLIVISTGMQFGFSKLETILPPSDGDFVVYYLRCDYIPKGPTFQYRPGLFGSQEEPRAQELEQTDDGIGKMLKPLKPRTFGVNSAEGLRKTLATILAEISKM